MSSYRLLCCLQVKLAEFSKTPEDFLRKYEELKSKNVRILDPLVYLLSKFCEDKEVTHPSQADHYMNVTSLCFHMKDDHIFTNALCTQMLQSLQQNAKERAESSANTTSTTTTSYSLPQTSTKMSMQELDELRKKLGNVTASSTAPLVSMSDPEPDCPRSGRPRRTRG